MEKSIPVIDDITRILKEFALTKSPVRALEVRGPVNEGACYRWRIVSTRYREATVVLKTQKPLFGKLKLRAIEIFGISPETELEPNLQDLVTYLQGAELIPV